ncbi:MAG: 23S rRNA (uracil(1939)-C(5))-methyltransferase RlmD, partial [Clostridiales bacterium]|nr:23S rRNA (uracil(1939)-C(5))-methyltransferase RlmD [Clostridiales bacterium]
EATKTTEVAARLRYQISPEAFFQVNTLQAEALYNAAVRACAPLAGKLVWDVYCGSGTLSLYLARQAGAVLGVDVSEASVRDARLNARLNGAGNARFLTGAAETLMPELASGGVPDLIVLDPPAKGVKPAVIDTILTLRPEKVLYISCDPATLARDLELLSRGGGYRIRLIQPVDMFPQTAHVETVVLLS